MRTRQPDGVTLINADFGSGPPSTLRISGARIAARGADPRAGDRVVDLRGARVLPGLINAHDHLQLNSLPRPELHQHYRHVREWIADVDALKTTDEVFKASVAVPRDERLLIGGIKNLLSGVTTVAHHDRLYPCLSQAHFPTRVVSEYGWAHSLYIEDGASVRRSYLATASHQPWIIHAAEGIDEEAANEFERLEALGCIRANTLVVHGIALNRRQQSRLHAAGAGLIWCPSSNLSLFGTTSDVGDLIRLGRVALGTDSRLSGSRDLLEELRLAAQLGGLGAETLESLVTRDAARLLRLPDRGALQAGARADILILPAATQLASAARSEVLLVMVDGIALYGDKHCAENVAPSARWTDVRVDGRPKVLERSLAELVAGASAREIGLELPQAAWRAA
jgi:hypothetical protein